MPQILTLDPATGHILADGFLITPDTQLDDLPPTFALGEEQDAYNGKRYARTRLAHCLLHEGTTSLYLSLCFEDDILVSGTIDLSAPEHENLSDFDFYSDKSDRWGFHVRWLRQQLGQTDHAYYTYPWGSAGVGRNKSENVFVYFTNLNHVDEKSKNEKPRQHYLNRPFVKRRKKSST